MNTKREIRGFCRRPFESVEIGVGGAARVCCWTDGHSIGNVSKMSLMEIWNGPKAKAFRDSIFDGSYRFCDKNICPHFAEGNKLCEVIIAPDRLKEDLSAVMNPDVQGALVKQTRHLPYPPKMIALCYDQTCNLSCPTCRKSVVNENLRKQEFDAITERLKPFADRLIFSGSGDPFFSSHFLDFMFNSTEADLGNVRDINIMTNGLLLTRRLWERVSDAFKKRKILLDISIDAANEATYSVNRRGGNWKTLLENLEFMAECSDFNQLTLSFVVQANNFRQMKDFVHLANRFGAKVSFRKLGNWGTFSQSEYFERNISSKAHPNHQEFEDLIRDDFFSQKHIEMPPEENEHVTYDPLIETGLGYNFFSQGKYAKSITPNVGNQFFGYNEPDFETDFAIFEKGYFSRKVIATAPHYMGFGFHHDEPFDLTPFSHVNLTVKSTDTVMNELNVLLSDADGEVRVKAIDFGFLADGRFHEVRIPLTEFSKNGLDLKKVICSFGIVIEGVREGDSFYINDLHVT